MSIVGISVEAQEFIQHLGHLYKRQINFATSQALNITADEIKAALQFEMKDSFDRPTPYALRGIRIRRSTKTDLTAEVSLQDSGGRNRPSQFLRPEIKGGSRGLKGFEQRIGGKYTVPGKDVRRDAYGNIPGGVITKMLSDSGLLRGGVTQRSAADAVEATAKRMASLRKRAEAGKAVYFIGRPGGGRLPEGVWERRKIGRYWVLRPMLVFLDKSPDYQPRLEWDFVTRLVYRRSFAVNFEQALIHARMTAK